MGRRKVSNKLTRILLGICLGIISFGIYCLAVFYLKPDEKVMYLLEFVLLGIFTIKFTAPLLDFSTRDSDYGVPEFTKETMERLDKILLDALKNPSNLYIFETHVCNKPILEKVIYKPRYDKTNVIIHYTTSPACDRCAVLMYKIPTSNYQTVLEEKDK